MGQRLRRVAEKLPVYGRLLGEPAYVVGESDQLAMSVSASSTQPQRARASASQNEQQLRDLAAL